LLQSAYRSYHSTKTALLKVLSDVLTAIDNKKVTLLALLDLSAAFDCVDHDILLSRLQSRFGLDGAVLAWIQSFLSDRTQRVCFGGRLLHEAIIGATIGATGCGNPLRRRKLNAEKTQLRWLGSRHQLAKLTISHLPLSSTTSSSTVDIVSTANDLGVILDSQLTMTTHVSSVCRAGFFQLRQLRSVRRSLTTEATRALLQTFISCRLDYCNSVLAGVHDVYLQPLQYLQNAAAHLVSGARRHDHITPVLVSLLWLPVCQRISYKTAVLV